MDKSIFDFYLTEKKKPSALKSSDIKRIMKITLIKEIFFYFFLGGKFNCTNNKM